MKLALLTAILGNKGRAITWGTGLLVSVITAGLGRLGFHLSEAAASQLVTVLTPLIAASLEGWASGINARGVKHLQRQMAEISPDVAVDGVAGPITIGAATRGVEAAAKLDSLRIYNFRADARDTQTTTQPTS